MNGKVKSFIQTVFPSGQYAVSKVTVFEVQSFGLDTMVFYSFIALSIIHCWKSAHKFAVRICQVDTVVRKTTQLVLSRFKKKLFTVFN